MKVLITGANGQLGTDLCQTLQRFEVIPLTHKDLDIADINSTKKVLLKHNPEVVINTAAYVRVDDCETEQDKAFLVNALGARNITNTKDLVHKIGQLINTEYYGIFPITNKGSCSWYEFAKEILMQAGLNIPIISITSDQYPQKAKRPHYSVLDNYHLRLLGMEDMRAWQEALEDYMKVKVGVVGERNEEK